MLEEKHGTECVYGRSEKENVATWVAEPVATAMVLLVVPKSIPMFRCRRKLLLSRFNASEMKARPKCAAWECRRTLLYPSLLDAASGHIRQSGLPACPGIERGLEYALSRDQLRECCRDMAWTPDVLRRRMQGAGSNYVDAAIERAF